MAPDLVDEPRGVTGARTQQLRWWEDDGERVLGGRHPVTSQLKVAPTLDGHECLAVGRSVKSHFPHQANARSQRALASHRLAFVGFVWEQTLSAGKGTPQGSATLVGRH